MILVNPEVAASASFFQPVLRPYFLNSLDTWFFLIYFTLLEMKTRVGNEARTKITAYILLAFEVGTRVIKPKLFHALTLSTKAEHLLISIDLIKLEDAHCRA